MPPVRMRRSVAGSARPAPAPETPRGTVRYLTLHELGEALGLPAHVLRANWKRSPPVFDDDGRQVSGFPAPASQTGADGPGVAVGWHPQQVEDVRAWRDAMPGSGVNKRVLTDEERQQARDEWAQRDTTGVTQAALAVKYGVDATTMSRIVRPEDRDRERRAARTRAGVKRKAK